METKWDGEQEQVRQTCRALAGQNPGLATQFLTGYTAAQAQLAWDWAKDMAQRLGNERIERNRPGC